MNNKVDLVDLVLLTKYYETVNADADLNGDGMIDLIDIVILAKNYNTSL